MICLAFEKYTWGFEYVLHDEQNYKVIRIELKTSKIISAQFHEKKAKTWTIIQGEAMVILNDKRFVLSEGDCIQIPVGAIHSIENTLIQKLIFIEIQTGKVLCDNDVKEIDEKQIFF